MHKNNMVMIDILIDLTNIIYSDYAMQVVDHLTPYVLYAACLLN